jgi:tetratricopeptide (TPR) repeat protein
MNFEGEIHQLRTEYAQARQAQEVILSQISPVLSPANYAYCLLNLVSLDLVTGANTAPVSQNLRTAVEIFRRINYPRGISLCEAHTADLKLCEGDTAGARHQYIRTFTDVYDIDNELACYCLAKLADSRHPVHTVPVVATWAFIFFAFVMRPAVRGILPVHQALQSLGNVFTHLGKDEEALSILTVALEGFTRMDVHRSRAECMQTIGDIHSRRGELSKASGLYTEARPLFERSSQAKALAEVDARLAELTEEDLRKQT